MNIEAKYAEYSGCTFCGSPPPKCRRILPKYSRRFSFTVA